MRFTCDKCQAKYTIADDKVRGKIVAVKCSKCGNKITVNGKTLVVPEEIPEERTRVASLVDLDALRAQEAAAAAASAGPAPASKPAPKSTPAPPAAKSAPGEPTFSDGWHAIIDRQQIGPLTPAELKKHLANGKLTARTYVWRDGQGDWKRAADIGEFAAALAPKPAAAAAPPPPPAPAPAPAPAKPSAASIRGKPVPSNGAAAAVQAQPKPQAEDFEQEDRPTMQRSDLDVAALEKMAREGEEGAAEPQAPTGDEQVEAPAAAAAAESPASREPSPDDFSEAALGLAAAPSASDPDSAPVTEPPAGGAEPHQDLKSMLFDDSQDPITGSHSKPIDLANAVAGDLDKKADPFAKVPDNPNISKPGEIGEQTRFFMKQAGVTRRNPLWKKLLVAFLFIALPVAVLYGFSLFNVGFLQVPTGVDEGGNEIKASVFSTDGLSGLRDILLKKKPAAQPKPKPTPTPKPKPPPGETGTPKTPDEGGPVVAKPDIKFDTLTDEQRKAMADATKDVGEKSGPKVDPSMLEAKLHVDGTAGLDAKVVGEVFAKNIKSFQGCVENELRRNPGFKGGKVNIGFTIGSSGVVTKASLDRPDLESTELGNCLKRRAKMMVFPSFEGEPFDVESPLVMAKGM